MRYHWEHAEVTKLAADVARVPDDVQDDCELVVSEAARMLRNLWKQNMKRSSGAYSKHYQSAITAYVKGTTAEVRPRPGAMQSGMNFEHGGPSIATRSTGGPIPVGNGKFIGGPGVGQRVGQTRPHLDMNRAADVIFPWFHREIAGNAEIPL